MEHLAKYLDLPIEFLWGALAIAGGVARYLNGFANGQPFKLSVFIASAFVAGFSGYMFALLGASLHFAPQFIYIMAGVGGFMGEQTMKLIWEYTSSRVPNKKHGA